MTENTKRRRRRRPNRQPREDGQSRALTKQWLEQLLGDAITATASGEKVGPRESLHLSAYYACIRNIGEDVAKLPLIVYEQLDRGKKRRPDLPIYSILHDAPNAEMTSFTFRSVLTSHSIGWGNGYAEIERNGIGEPVALWPLIPEDVTPKRVNGRIVYEVRRNGASPDTLESDQMFHIPGLGYDGLVGHSPAWLAAQSIGIALATQKFSGSFFGNGAWMSGALKHPAKLSNQGLENLRSSIKARHAGAENAFGILILQEGMDWVNTSIPPKDALLVDSRYFDVEDICRWFRMPPHKVGHLLRAQGWSTLEQTNIDYLTDTLMPWLVRWEQEIKRKLIRKPGLFSEHLVDGLLRADTTTRYTAYKTAIDARFMTPNEVRERENMNPIEGGDELQIPQGAAVPDKPQDEPKDKPEDDDA